ncbi:MAG TPA: hypothetical protein VMU24_04960 [Candidatus Acidoferrales bacterium]|nr:hypothetical protein [Candidatus Acidoferrales bacterium]
MRVARIEDARSERETMTCAEFQQALPHIIDGGGDVKYEEHLKRCTVCADLVADLRYIAEQAKLLVPMHDPSPRVWTGIERSLLREGLVKPAQARRGLLGPKLIWIIPAAIGVGVAIYILAR